MKLTRAALLVLLPSVAAAGSLPALPEIRLESGPFTLVQNALESIPPVDLFAINAPRKVPIHYVSHMPVVSVPLAENDGRMVHQPDPSVDYKLTVVDPEVGDGK
jgi:hypothetical protein